jgi:hypothetical protein
MLALSDEALGHLAIAATAIAPAERSAWLKSIATKLDPSPQQVASQRWKERRRRGRIQLKIETDETDLILALCDNNLLSVNQADDPAAINAAARIVVERFAQGHTCQPHAPDVVKLHLLVAILREKLRRATRAAKYGTRRHRRSGR